MYPKVKKGGYNFFFPIGERERERERERENKTD